MLCRTHLTVCNVLPTVPGGAGVELLAQPADCLGCHLSGHVAVEGRGVAALLHVAQDVVPHRELVLALLGVQPEAE